MKRLQILIMVLLVTAQVFSQINSNEKNCEAIPIEQFRELEDFSDIITRLQTENRLTISDASAIKMVSSNSFVAFEQTPDSIVNQHGKITEDDIELIVHTSFNDNKYLVIITSCSGFGHAFKYDTSTKNLIRLKNNGHLVFPWIEALQVKGCDDSKITLFAKSKPEETEGWIKYYSLDLERNIFTNTKNCRVVDNEEKCKATKQVEFVRAYSSKSCPMPPFAKLITEVTSETISIRSVLPPRHQMRESFLEAYDLWDTTTKIREIEKTDFDTIVNFILNSGLLNIDLNYPNPKNPDGIAVAISGACGFGYVIETSESKINLPISGAGTYNIPDIVSEFNGLYYSNLSKYFEEKDYEPDFYSFLKLRQK